MDFIERLLGISPDGGDGSIEVMIIGVVVLLALAAAWRWRSRYPPPSRS
jgi:MYXO-CTERM domain-containing protein